MKTYINLNAYNLRLKNGKWYKTLFMQLLKMMVCQNWAYINSFLNNLFIKHHFTLIVVNGCMVCPTTVSLLILSSRSKTSSSNLLLSTSDCLALKRGCWTAAPAQGHVLFSSFLAYIFPLTHALQYKVFPTLHHQ